MAIGQSPSYNGQKPINEISRSDFVSVSDSEPLKVLPESYKDGPESEQGIATYVKVFVLEKDKSELVLNFIRKLLEVPTVVKIALAPPGLDIAFLKAVDKIVPPHVRFGVCDYDAAGLQTLINEGIRISFCSINADACCALPQDILALSRDTGIKLIAHHDSIVLKADFGAAVSRSVSLHEKRQVVAHTAYHYVE